MLAVHSFFSYSEFPRERLLGQACPICVCVLEWRRGCSRQNEHRLHGAKAMDGIHSLERAAVMLPVTHVPRTLHFLYPLSSLFKYSVIHSPSLLSNFSESAIGDNHNVRWKVRLFKSPCSPVAPFTANLTPTPLACPRSTEVQEVGPQHSSTFLI